MSGLPTERDPFQDAIRDLLPMDATEALRRIRALVQTEPDWPAVQSVGVNSPETLKWLGELHALLSSMKLTGELVALKVASGMLVRYPGLSTSAADVRALLYRVLAEAELKAPASEQGTFIAAGNELDAYAAVSKVLASAKSTVLVVDPYMDGKALTDFLPSSAEGVFISILSDQATLKPTLGPAAERWTDQFGDARPLQVRLAPARTLHDRLILVDGDKIWSLSQSLKDFANRAHGSILKVDPETAALKIAAYMDIWDSATAL
jgi:hypothetical protein